MKSRTSMCVAFFVQSCLESPVSKAHVNVCMAALSLTHAANVLLIYFPLPHEPASCRTAVSAAGKHFLLSLGFFWLFANTFSCTFSLLMLWMEKQLHTLLVWRKPKETRAISTCRGFQSQTHTLPHTHTISPCHWRYWLVNQGESRIVLTFALEPSNVQEAPSHWELLRVTPACKGSLKFMKMSRLRPDCYGAAGRPRCKNEQAKWREGYHFWLTKGATPQWKKTSKNCKAKRHLKQFSTNDKYSCASLHW